MKKKRVVTIAIVVMIVYVTFLFCYGRNIEQKEHDVDSIDSSFQQEATPYIEFISNEKDFVLVSPIIYDWFNGTSSAVDLYQQCADKMKPYEMQLVELKYFIYNIPSNIEIQSQKFEYSLNQDLTDAEVILIEPTKRKVQLQYLYVDTLYFYRLSVQLSNGETICYNGSFQTEYTPRIITTDPLRNIRDIGGWKTVDGKSLKQGICYRGSELDGAVESRFIATQPCIDLLTNELGIKTEIDIRNRKTPNTKDMLGEDVVHEKFSCGGYMDFFDVASEKYTRKVFSKFADKDAYPIYIHCTYGKDRTGTVCYFLQALLGVSEEDLYKEWELSAFVYGEATYDEMDRFINHLQTFPGNTMQEKTEWYLKSVGVTQQQIDNIKEIFLED